jgi:superfamily II DNA/RNA helicase
LRENQIKLLGSNVPPCALSWEELNLPVEIQRVVGINEWTSPTPIQSVSVPVGLKGRDLIGIAKTGSGKTGAFVVPAMVHIMRQVPMQRGDGPIVLVLSPTRELAQQTSEVSSKFASAIRVGECCVFGGAGRNPQMMQLRRSPAIVVACPGRLIDFLESGAISLERVSFLVLDEADRMLDMGFEEQIRKIIGRITQERQTLMFSATWPKDVRQLATDFLVDPIHMIIGASELTTNSSIKQVIERVEEWEKLTKCCEFLVKNPEAKVLIFTKTKRSADDLADNLTGKKLYAWSIHGEKPQSARDFVLGKFKQSKSGILVATDVASRGLDVTDIDIVVNFDFPGDIESYIHRIGRTARGTKTGLSLSYFTDENKNLSRKLVKVMTQAQQEIPDWLMKMASVTPRGASRQGGYFGRGGGGGHYDRRPMGEGYGSGRNTGFGSGGFGSGRGGYRSGNRW